MTAYYRLHQIQFKEIDLQSLSDQKFNLKYRNIHYRRFNCCTSCVTLFETVWTSDWHRSQNYSTSREVIFGLWKQIALPLNTGSIVLVPRYAQKYWLTAVMSKGRIKTRSITRKLSPLWLEKSCHVCLKIAVTQSFSFVTAVRDVFRLFLNVPEVKEKQRQCLNLLLKTKDVIGFHGFGKQPHLLTFWD